MHMTATLASSTLNAAFMQLVNEILASMVTTPGGNTPVPTTFFLGSMSAQELDCSALGLQLTAPASGAVQAAISFPGSQNVISGYLNLATLGNIMNPNTLQLSNAAQLGPAASVGLTAGNIQKLRSGQVLVLASLSAALSVQTPITFSLYRDNALLLTQSVLMPGGNPSDAAASLHYLDTLPDANPHSYVLTAAGAGTLLTVPAGQAVITAVEL